MGKQPDIKQLIYIATIIASVCFSYGLIYQRVEYIGLNIAEIKERLTKIEARLGTNPITFSHGN